MKVRKEAVKKRTGVADSTAGTHFMGHVVIGSYNEIKALFGEPMATEVDGKVNAHFSIILDGEVVFTIYDWKLDESPIRHPARNYGWHIGAFDYISANKALKFLTEVARLKVPSEPHYLFQIR